MEESRVTGAPSIPVGPMPCMGCRRLLVYVRREMYDYIPRSQRTIGGWYRARLPHDCPALSPLEREAMAAAAKVLGRRGRLRRVLDSAA